jgi:peroxiredoxin
MKQKGTPDDPHNPDDFIKSMGAKMKEANILADKISKEYNMPLSDAFIIAISQEDSKPYIRDLKIKGIIS